MEAIINLLQARASRGNLDTTKQYIMIRNDNGKKIQTEVGQFIRAYNAGSGEGMTLHWEFKKDGVIICINDQMWGSVHGEELVGFIEK
jgi:hypothetical protein